MVSEGLIRFSNIMRFTGGKRPIYRGKQAVKSPDEIAKEPSEIIQEKESISRRAKYFCSGRCNRFSERFIHRADNLKTNRKIKFNGGLVFTGHFQTDTFHSTFFEPD